MLEILDFAYSKSPAILKWFAEMRKIEGDNKANENFEKSKGFIRQLMSQNPKL